MGIRPDTSKSRASTAVSTHGAASAAGGEPLSRSGQGQAGLRALSISICSSLILCLCLPIAIRRRAPTFALASTLRAFETLPLALRVVSLSGGRTDVCHAARPRTRGEHDEFAKGGEEGEEAGAPEGWSQGGKAAEQPSAESPMAGRGARATAADAAGGAGDGAEHATPLKSGGGLVSPVKSETQFTDGSPVQVAAARRENLETMPAPWSDSREQGGAEQAAGDDVPRAVRSAASEGWLKVRILTLYNNCIADAACIVLAKALGSNSTITSLSLRCNRVADLGLQAISLALTHNQTLRVMDLSMNEIGDAGARGLAGVCASPSHAAASHVHFCDRPIWGTRRHRVPGG